MWVHFFVETWLIEYVMVFDNSFRYLSCVLVMHAASDILEKS